MTSKKSEKKAETAPDTVLRYGGTGRFAGVAARDLTEHDIARLAYLREASRIGADGRRSDPRNPDPDVVNEITAELTGSGLYTREG